MCLRQHASHTPSSRPPYPFLSPCPRHPYTCRSCKCVCRLTHSKPIHACETVPSFEDATWSRSAPTQPHATIHHKYGTHPTTHKLECTTTSSTPVCISHAAHPIHPNCTGTRRPGEDQAISSQSAIKHPHHEVDQLVGSTQLTVTTRTHTKVCTTPKLYTDCQKAAFQAASPAVHAKCTQQFTREVTESGRPRKVGQGSCAAQVSFHRHVVTQGVISAGQGPLNPLSLPCAPTLFYLLNQHPIRKLTEWLHCSSTT